MKIYAKKLLRCFLPYIVAPFILELIIESLNRKSVIAGFEYMIDSPLLFLFNMMIIMLTLSVASFFKREVFVFSSISIVWLIFGIVNFVILHFRVTPFSAVDFTLIKSAISVSGHYLSVLNIAMLVVAVAVIVFSIICLYRKAPYHNTWNHKRFAISVLSVFILSMAIVFIKSSSNSVQALATNYTNISEAYENYGFVYCFTNSIIDTGIAKPDDYSEESVKAVKDKLKKSKTKLKDNPNIIMIQLESFFDVDNVKGMSFSEDPLPVFHSLEENYSSGLLTVPTVGAGTVNTEFEVLTGMRQHDFGVCEYPYKTVLKSTASESVCNNLSKLGYKSHAVHNNEATFYGRNKVFSSLGFDSFTSKEYMNGITENPNGWSNDDIMSDEIIKTLDSTDGPDFTFGITVQSHGKYDVDTDINQKIKVSGAPAGMESQYSYYVNEIAEVDDMIGDLIDKLSKRDEKSVVVLYGDHLPSLDITVDELNNASLYQTQYVIWDNLGLKKEDKDIASYQLYPEVFNRLGIHEGLIDRYQQQTDENSEDYLSDLATLEYDLLYGENYAYNGSNPFEASDMTMGTDKVKIKDVKKTDDGYVVTGKGFTGYTEILFNGNKLKGEFIDDSHIRIDEESIEYDDSEDYISLEEAKEEEIAPEDIPNAFVAQFIDDDGIVLSTSDALPYKATSLD
ncbi:MAG: sulfatase-like hydrolase/transferase [Lachnospiraceae bacterium]|nr:sulfatase-like hydrolase/transferase [Lachnospiraceae bacterium]